MLGLHQKPHIALELQDTTLHFDFGAVAMYETLPIPVHVPEIYIFPPGGTKSIFSYIDTDKENDNDDRVTKILVC